MDRDWFSRLARAGRKEVAVWWIRGGRIGHELLSFPGVRLVLPHDGRAEATTRNAVNGRSETGRNGQAIEPRVVVQGYRLGRIWDLREGESRLEFRDRTAAAGFLQRLATDPCVLATLRSTHAGVGASSAIHRLGDRVVLDQLAGHLVDRSLEVVVEYHLLPPVTTATYELPAVPEVSRPPDDRPAPDIPNIDTAPRTGATGERSPGPGHGDSPAGRDAAPGGPGWDPVLRAMQEG